MKSALSPHNRYLLDLLIWTVCPIYCLGTGAFVRPWTAKFFAAYGPQLFALGINPFGLKQPS